MENWNWLRSQLTPPQIRSWQTLILASFVTWFFSLLVMLSEPDVEFQSFPLTRLGWVFFLVGFIWWQSLHPWKLGSLSLTPGLIAAVFCCLFLTNPDGELSQWVFLFYPILTTLIAVLPACRNPKNRLSLPAPQRRPVIMLQLLIALLCSCWLQLTFVLQHWIDTYPQLARTNLSQSQFVLRTGTPFQLRGYPQLQALQKGLKTHFDGPPWPETERKLLDLRQNPENFWRTLNIGATEATDGLVRYPQASLTRDEQQGYYLTIRLSWSHPWFEERREHLSLRCHLYPVSSDGGYGTGSPSDESEIACDTDNAEIFNSIDTPSTLESS